jgi:indole-3-glycerol phosphate synthase
MSILDTIVERTSADVAVRRQAVPLAVLEARLASARPVLPFADALRRKSGGRPTVIAELKKASPSKGLIRADFAPLALAQELADAGASALSVLTEPHFFQGHPDYLAEVAPVVPIPCLRKDFIVDEYQVVEARALGASALLLIAAALTDGLYSRLFALAREVGLGVLTEVHDEAELARVLPLGVDVVGVNSRNLKTFQVDLAVAERMLGQIPASQVRIAESGVANGGDMARLVAAGADGFLVGETLMRAAFPGNALRELLAQYEACGQ